MREAVRNRHVQVGILPNPATSGARSQWPLGVGAIQIHHTNPHRQEIRKIQLDSNLDSIWILWIRKYDFNGFCRWQFKFEICDSSNLKFVTVQI